MVTDRSLKESYRQRLHGTGSAWNRYKIGTDKPCVYMGFGGSGMDRICCLVPDGSTYECDPIWNRTIPVSIRSHVNRVDPYHSGSDPKRIWTYLILCKRSHNQSTYQDLCIEEKQKSENQLSLNKVESEVFTLRKFLHSNHHKLKNLWNYSVLENLGFLCRRPCDTS